jgi:thioredoxin-like negative regulator of GroEL
MSIAARETRMSKLREPRVPSAVHQRLSAGTMLLQSGRLEGVAPIVEDLLHSHGDNPEVLLLACDLRLAQDDAQAALALIEYAVSLAPASLRLLSRNATVLMALMRRADAKLVAERIAGIASDDAQAMWEAGRIHARSDDPARAEHYLKKARALGCEEPELLYELATAQFFLGKTHEAEDTLQLLLSRSGDSGGAALYLRSVLREQTPAKNHVEDLERRLRTGFRRPGDAAGCLYALAKEYEDLGEWQRSFAVLQKGSRCMRGSLRYDAAEDLASMQRISEVYTADAMQAGAPGHDAVAPIFVVGLPRTGTTLLERILARHPDAASVGELPYFSGGLTTALRRLLRSSPRDASDPVRASLGIDFEALGRTYLDGVRQAADRPDAARFVDKMPPNFMYCGLIHKALPQASIIHVVRDPMDACYAIYKALFQHAYHFSYDLFELADYYIAYHRLMRHWHEAMPGRILDVRYEELVDNPEAQARRVIAWCGLAWTPAVMDSGGTARPASTASATQVRAPVHTRSVGRWRHYESELAALRERLLEAGIAA